MAGIKKQSLSDQLYEQIRTNIINLTYPLGSKLNVQELQEVFEVSSTPIREAINRLQIEGLVTYENNIGARVLSLGERDIYEIQALALVLHTAAIRFAMDRGDHRQMADEMQACLDEYYQAKTDEQDVNSVFNFMGVFYHHCGNHRLDNNMKVIQGEQLVLRYLYRRHAKSDKNPNNYLEQIKTAVLKGDTDEIIRLLEQDYDEATPILVKSVQALDTYH